MDEMTKLESYLEGLKIERTKVPGWAETEKPNFRVISAASGVAHSCLRSRPYRRRIKLAVQELGLADPLVTQRAMRRDAFNKRRMLISDYLKWLQDQGYKLPENPKRKGEVYFPQVGVESGIGGDFFRISGRETETSYTMRLRRMLETAASHIGVEIRLLPQSPGNVPAEISYEHLLGRGTEQRKQELEGRRGSRQQLYNTRAALTRFRKAARLKPADPVGAELTVDFNNSVRSMLEEIRNGNSRKKFQTEIIWWHDLYRRMLKEQSLPEEFHEALAYLVNRSCLPLNVLAKLADVQGLSLTTWCHGQQTPSARSLPGISRIESLFRLPAGTLTNKVLRCRLIKNIPRSQLPPLLLKDTSLARKVRQHLPHDFLDRPKACREEIVKYICDEVLEFDDPYTRRLTELQRLKYTLVEWPRQLHREFDDLAVFKTAGRPPLGMNRNGQWRPSTREMMRELFAHFFGAINLPNDGDEIRLRGLGIPADDLTMALLACPLVVDWYLRFRCEVRNTYTEYALKLLQTARSLLRSGTGWLRQHPKLAYRLRPLSDGPTDIVPPSLIAKARKNWAGVCDDASKYYKHLMEEIEPAIGVGRSPFSRIEGILNLENPVRVFEILAAEMISDLPNQRTRPVHYHVAVRNCVMILLIQLTGLRRNTVAQLDYADDNTGHLKLEGEEYILDIPRHLFKVEDAPFFGPKRSPSRYRMELRDVYGFYGLLSEYLNVSRPFLLKRYHQENGELALFVNSKQAKSARVCSALVYEVYSDATAKYLVMNKYVGKGILGVKPHGPHTSRHIRATSVLKKGGSFQDAADANHNSEKTARKYYARWSTADRNNRINNLLFGDK